MREFSCLTWNIAKRIKYSEEQVNFINSFKPDVVALQEVLISSDKKLKDLLSRNYVKSLDRNIKAISHLYSNFCTGFKSAF